MKCKNNYFFIRMDKNFISILQLIKNICKSLLVVIIIANIYIYPSVSAQTKTNHYKTKEIIKRSLMSGLKNDCIVPDVIDTEPTQQIKINYSGIEVNFGNELTPTQVKDKPSVDWPAEKGALYTLAMTDPDAPSRQSPTYGEVKHWLVINIPGSQVSSGQFLADYIGSGPPKDTGLHRYVFLVYKQKEKIYTNEESVGSRSLTRRMKFKIREFAKQNNLGEPIAANYYQAQYDDYVPIFRSQFAQ